MSSSHQDRPGENLLTTEERTKYYEILLDADGKYRSRINDWEGEFVHSLLVRFERFGKTVRVSEKQKNKLDDIEKKIYAT